MRSKLQGIRFKTEMWQKWKFAKSRSKLITMRGLSTRKTCQKYMEGINDDTNKLFIPNYQRELVWDEARQSKFIESVISGLPIPSIFVVDIGHDENDEPR